MRRNESAGWRLKRKSAQVSGVLILLTAVVLAFSGCEKKSTTPVPKAVAEEARESPKAEPSPQAEDSPKAEPSPSAKAEKQKPREGYAVWYDVPDNSLARRRGGKGELTAAHNRLPLGAMVRVTHLENGKSVIVRITDRGVMNRASIDLCKEAAEELGMVREGKARVRMEVLPDDKGFDPGPDSTGTAAHP